MPTIALHTAVTTRFFDRPSTARRRDGYVAVEGAERAGSATRVRWQPARYIRRAKWITVSHVRGEAVLFSYSDRPVQEKFGLWREQRGNA